MRRSISTRRGKDGTGVNIREISLAGAAGSSLCRAISGAARTSCSTSCGRMGGAAGSPKIFSTSTGGGGVGTDQDCGACAGGTGGAHPPAAGLVSAARAACAPPPASAAARAASAVGRRGLEDLLFLHLRGKLLRARFGGACRLLRRAR